MALVVRHSRAAMGSRCDVLLCGDDAEQLDAVAVSAFAEIARVEQLLSRFDPTSEISRINREAPQGECLVDVELMAVLADCRHWWERTQGVFDIVAGSRGPGGVVLTSSAVQLDPRQRRIRFRERGVRLDLGGYGKGYALDCGTRVIREQHVAAACLQIGTSSVSAIGHPPGEAAWSIEVPGQSVADPLRRRVPLIDASLSTSAIDRKVADLIVPETGRAVTEPRSCTVVAPSGAAAEALSTALAVMGPDRGRCLLQSWNDPTICVYWNCGAEPHRNL